MMKNTNTANTTTATTLNNITRIITHSGVFHADEVACVALVELAKGAEVKVLRTRDQEIETNIATDLVVDVFGGEFDHHTEEKLDRFGNKLSSIGLLWAGYKSEFMELLELNQTLVRPLETIIQQLDKMDNGEKADNVLAFNLVIGAFNAPDIGNNDGNFRQAVDFMKVYLQQAIVNCKLLQLQYDKSWSNKQINGKVVVLPSFVPDWENRAAQEDLDVQFACTFEPWANQNSVQRTRNCTLDLNTLDVQGVSFTHKAGFLAKVSVDATPRYLDELNKLI